MSSSLDLLICKTCGTQFSETPQSRKSECRICDDPRQFVPPSGQSFTTLRELREGGEHENKWQQDEFDKRVCFLQTEPKFAIGQRAFLLQTKHGNVLWDLIAYLDKSTIEKINSLGGLKAIVISHPHFYTTHVEWAKTFNCPVYTSVEDTEWLHRTEVTDVDRRFIKGATEKIVEGVTAVKVGGHFDGSLVLHWDSKLFIADSLLTIQSAYYHKDRLPGTSSYSFMWSIPNFIPLPPDKIANIWKAVRHLDFTSSHGLMVGMDVHDTNLKKRILESAKIQVRAEGYVNHELLKEEWP